MSNEVFKKFQELMNSDTVFQGKLHQAAEQYKGDPSDAKAIFEGVLLPLGEEYGLSATFEEFSKYAGALVGSEDGELSSDELAQVAGGKGGGVGAGGCLAIGLGIGGGGAGDETSPVNGGLCVVLGIGYGGYSCFGKGEPEKL